MNCLHKNNERTAKGERSRWCPDCGAILRGPSWSGGWVAAKCVTRNEPKKPEQETSAFPHIRRLGELMAEPAPVGVEERVSEPWRYTDDQGAPCDGCGARAGQSHKSGCKHRPRA